MLSSGMHDFRVGNRLSVWQLEDEDDGEGVPSFVRGCRNPIEGKGGQDSVEVTRK